MKGSPEYNSDSDKSCDTTDHVVEQFTADDEVQPIDVDSDELSDTII